jgi:hypothetical protein
MQFRVGPRSQTGERILRHTSLASRKASGRNPMADNKPQAIPPSASNPSPRTYSSSLQSLLQSLLASLADINFEYEREQERVRGRTMDVDLKIRVLEKLKQQHRERREPYIQQLAVLLSRIQQGWQ